MRAQKTAVMCWKYTNVTIENGNTLNITKEKINLIFHQNTKTVKTILEFKNKEIKSKFKQRDEKMKCNTYNEKRV